MIGFENSAIEGSLRVLSQGWQPVSSPGSARLKFAQPVLLVIDEIHYLPVSPDSALPFFQLINAGRERVPTVLTSNKGFEDWGGRFAQGGLVGRHARSTASSRPLEPTRFSPICAQCSQN